MILEIATYHLKEPTGFGDSSSTPSKVIRGFLSTAVAEYGAHDAYYGQLIEKPTIVISFAGWDSMEDHYKFMSSP